MDDVPIIRPRTPTGPMGYLNYPPEIMNRIYQEIFIDPRQVLAFLCSPDPAFNFIGLKTAVADHQSPRNDPIEWPQLYDARYYTDGGGLSAQFLSVCKKIWSEASPVLYGNLTIAMRWAPRYPDPCVFRFFKDYAPYVLEWAKLIHPQSPRPSYNHSSIENKDFVGRLMHWGVTHDHYEYDTRSEILRQLGRDRIEMTRYSRMKSRTVWF